MARVLTLKLREKIKANPLLGDIRSFRIHEGMAHSTRPFGSKEDDVSGYEELSTELKISNEEIIIEGVGAFFKRIDTLAEDMIKQQSGIVFQKINEITAKTGNVVEGKDRPLGPDLIFEGMEKMQIDFGPDGKPSNLVFVMHPTQWEKIKDKIPEWEANPEFTAKFEKIMEKKRKEWIDRENSRKLVD